MDAKTKLRYLSYLSPILIVLGIIVIAIIFGNWGNFRDTFVVIDPNFSLYLIGCGILGGFGVGVGIGIAIVLSIL